MLRKRVLIHKSELDKWIFNDSISKVEIAKSYNKNLKNPDLIVMYVYYKTTKKQWANACQMLLRCADFGSTDLADQETKDKISGMSSDRFIGFVTDTHIKYIMETQKKYNYNFCVPKWVRNYV